MNQFILKCYGPIWGFMPEDTVPYTNPKRSLAELRVCEGTVSEGIKPHMGHNTFIICLKYRSIMLAVVSHLDESFRVSGIS